MTDDFRLHDDVEAYVLGALDEPERAQFERHLDGCPSCQREIASYLPVLRALREMPLPAPPPLHSRAKKAVSFPTVAFGWAAAAVVALTIGGFGGASFERAQSNEMVTVAEMGVTAAQEIPLQGDGAKGRAIVGEARQRTAFVVAGLPEPGPNRDYQVWITNGATTSPGVLHRSMKGFEVLVVPGDMLHGAQSIRVTLEPSGGSERMTGRPLISSNNHEV